MSANLVHRTTDSSASLVVIGAFLCLMMAYLIAAQPIVVPLYLTGGVLLLYIGFFHTRLAIYGIILSMLLSPEIGFGPSAGGRPVTIRLEDVLLLMVGMAWLAKAAYYKELGLLRKNPLSRPIGAYALAAIVATAMSAWWGPFDGIKALLFLAKYLEYFILYFLVLNVVESRRDIERYLAAALITCFIVSLVGIAQIPAGNRVSAPFEGEVGEPNTLGGYLVLMLSIVAGFYLITSSFRARLLWAGFAVLIVLPLLYTLSRTSWGAALAAVVILFAYGPRKSHVMTAVVLALALYPVLAPQQVLDRLEYTFHQPESRGQIKIGDVRLDTSASARIESWGYGLRGWAARPITGHGVSGFAFLDAQYMLVLVETGLLGLAAFGWLAFCIWRLAVHRLREARDPFARSLCLGYLAGFAALLVHGLGANTFIIIRIMEPFWLLTALVVALPDYPHDDRLPPEAFASRLGAHVV